MILSKESLILLHRLTRNSRAADVDQLNLCAFNIFKWKKLRDKIVDIEN